ncbi:hypothetical protein VaNZ11_009035, partial [Volvox africanus]
LLRWSARCRLRQRQWALKGRPAGPLVAGQWPTTRSPAWRASAKETRVRESCGHWLTLTHTRTHSHSHSHTHTHTHTHTQIHIHKYTYTYTYTNTHTQIHIHIHIHKYTYTYTHSHRRTWGSAAMPVNDLWSACDHTVCEGQANPLTLHDHQSPAMVAAAAKASRSVTRQRLLESAEQPQHQHRAR